ncbi:unnamed protein product [Penicillium pancosmium]
MALNSTTSDIVQVSDNQLHSAIRGISGTRLRSIVLKLCKKLSHQRKLFKKRLDDSNVDEADDHEEKSTDEKTSHGGKGNFSDEDETEDGLTTMKRSLEKLPATKKSTAVEITPSSKVKRMALQD